ncbi:MBOAT family O-acyltransferase [Pontibacter sp. G13]|uniref:MBOAT family O-acyltransferase n=1 Tax=Pontibacter sp. G13 TaxID=3074898 RepID=UPI00288AEEBC|nr:MBOAT family O-acyltransferase [Pontibacter sp. G13]WNJ19715.1 MBOAT family O-acyltransferase [Pontibacter sp. G13]
MIFNSLDFAVFLPLVFVFFWLLRSYRNLQNAWLLLASYCFYGWWDWRFLSLIFISSAVDFLVGLQLDKTQKSQRRRAWVAFSLTVNLGILGFFKYYGFFVETLIDTWKLFGHELSIHTLDIILPVGISFYTFQTLSYTIDIYRGKIAATTNPIKFFAYVSFFPQLVAGPIERAAHLLPQFDRTKTFSFHQAADGLRQFLWGLFKKVAIADGCAHYVDTIFNSYQQASALTLLAALFLFSFQIYGDFSGYSDMAIGIARLFGFQLQPNFRTPYFAVGIGDFWRRWHISLSGWFRDYLYIPMGGSRGPLRQTILNTLTVFTISGFWHGASGTFLIWGLWHAVLFIPSLLRKHLFRQPLIPSWSGSPFWTALMRIQTFWWVMLSWIWFRANDITHAWRIFVGIATKSWIAPHPPITLLEPIFGFIAFMLLCEWRTRRELHPLSDNFLRLPRPIRWWAYIMGCMVIIYHLNTRPPIPYIYFDF